MTIEKIKAMFDACYLAKRSRDLLPPLPKGVTPSYIHYLDVVESLGQQGVSVKVSDISDALDIPRPGVTRTVKEMQAKGYLHKQTSESDGRVTYITVTDEGRNMLQVYSEQYFNRLLPLLEDISEEDAECTIRTIEKLYKVMSERSVTIE